MFRQRLGEPAWRLTLNHLENYNHDSDGNIPVAPEAYRRDGTPFGDQYSNFNAGKILLYLEGLAGLEYSVPDKQLVVHDTMPSSWKWMEVRFPLQLQNKTKTHWPTIRYERNRPDLASVQPDRTDRTRPVIKMIRVSDCPLQITIEPWLENKRVVSADSTSTPQLAATRSEYPQYRKYVFDKNLANADVSLTLAAEEN